MQCSVCNKELKEKVNYCPRCGWSTAQLNYKEEITFIVPSDRTSVEWLNFYNLGMSQVKLTLESQCPGFYFIDHMGNQLDQYNVVIQEIYKDKPYSIKVRIVPDELRATKVVKVKVYSNDLKPERFVIRDIWDRECLRESLLSIIIDIWQAAQLDAIEEIMIFTENLRRRPLTLVNRGDYSLTVKELNIPENFKLEDGGKEIRNASQIQILPHQKKVYHVLARNPFEGRQSISFLTENNEKVQVVLYEEFKDEVTVSTRYIIGIDFGTYKTAVFYHDRFQDEFIPQAITFNGKEGETGDTKEYFRSCLLKFKNEPHFHFGDEAEKLKEAGIDHYFRSSMKTLLREENVTEEVYGKVYTSYDLVAEFLGYIRHGIYNSKQIDTAFPVKYIFSLPVLQDIDHDLRAFDKQKENTLKAAKKAGFDEEQIEFDLEPCCAARHFIDKFINSETEKEYFVRDGNKICVYDFGAGTVDVTIIRLKVKENIPSFEILGNFGLPVGGDSMDEFLKDYILKHYNISIDKAKEDMFTTFVRGLKEALSKELSVESYFENAQIKVTRKEFEKLIDILVEQTVDGIARMLSRLNLDHSEINYVFMTGGCSQIPFVQENIKNFFRYSKIIISRETDDTILAVVRGAVLSHNYRFVNVVPYNIYLTFETKEVLIFEKNVTHTGMEKIIPLEFPPNIERYFSVNIRYEQKNWRIKDFVITNQKPHREIYVLRFTLEQNLKVFLEIMKRDGSIYREKEEIYQI